MTPTVNIADCAECHCLAARRQAREITRIYEDHLRPYGLRATQFSVLVALELSGRVPLGTLAEALGLDRTTLTRSASLMEQRGWICPVRSDDGRERPIALTHAGRRTLVAAYPAWKTAQELVGHRSQKGSEADLGRTERLRKTR